MPEPPLQRVEALFHQAAALDPGQRSTFLDARCAGDTELRRAVEELLKLDGGAETAADFLASPIIRATARPPAAVPPAQAAAGQPPARPPSRYALGGIHATGGMGRVWLARDTSFDREVALKELRPEIA